MKIQCSSCKKIVAETTDAYKPDVRPNGSMLELAEPYKSRGWDLTMNWTVGTCCAELFCPLCEYPLAPSGRFTLIAEFVCPKCGKVCKSKAGLVGHLRHCEGKE